MLKEYDISHKLVLVGKNENNIFGSIPFDKENVTVTGYVTEGELKYAYEQADVFLFPSVHEGFGLPPLEAMACGTPVVASSAASLPEVVGDAGILINPEDTEEFANAILRIIQNNDHRNDLVEKGYRRTKTFTWENTKNLLIESFDKATPQ
jgi:glycosyltransferase involved in cell wall biosynthesis